MIKPHQQAQVAVGGLALRVSRREHVYLQGPAQAVGLVALAKSNAMRADLSVDNVHVLAILATTILVYHFATTRPVL